MAHQIIKLNEEMVLAELIYYYLVYYLDLLRGLTKTSNLVLKALSPNIKEKKK